MVPTAYIEHQIPGRSRLRISEKRGEVVYFQRVIASLSRLAGVQELDSSPLSGQHSHPPFRRLLDAIPHRCGQSRGSLRSACSKGESDPKNPSKKPPKKPHEKPHGDAGILDTIATGLSGLALFQISQGQITGSAAENFWNAYGAQRLLGNRDHNGWLRAAGRLPAISGAVAWFGVLIAFLRTGGPPDHAGLTGRPARWRTCASRRSPNRERRSVLPKIGQEIRRIKLISFQTSALVN